MRLLRGSCSGTQGSSTPGLDNPIVEVSSVGMSMFRPLRELCVLRISQWWMDLTASNRTDTELQVIS